MPLTEAETIARYEPPATKAARVICGRVNQIENKLLALQVEFENAKIELCRALNRMREAGDPDTGWATHWRMRLNMDR